MNETYLVAKRNEIVGTDGHFVFTQLDAVVLQREALIHLLHGMCVDLSRLVLAVAHEYIVADERDD